MDFGFEGVERGRGWFNVQLGVDEPDVLPEREGGVQIPYLAIQLIGRAVVVLRAIVGLVVLGPVGGAGGVIVIVGKRINRAEDNGQTKETT